MQSVDSKLFVNEMVIALSQLESFTSTNIKNVVSGILVNYDLKYVSLEEKESRFSTEFLMKRFEEGKTAIGMSNSTITQYRLAVKVLKSYVDKELSEITCEDVNDFLCRYRTKVSSVTVRNKYQLLSSIFNYLYDRKYLSFNPIKNITPPKAEIIIKKPLTELNLEKIKKCVETSFPKKEYLRNMALVHFFICTGCRVSEVSHLKVSNVDFENKTVTVMGKGRKERIVILTDRAIYRLKLYLASRTNVDVQDPLFASVRGEHSISRDAIRQIIVKIRKLSNVKYLTAHVFRRYYATELRKKDVPIQMIATSLGHSNLNTINRYSLYTSDELESEIRKAL